MADESESIRSSNTGSISTDTFDVHRKMVVALFTATLVLCLLLGVGVLTSTVSVLFVVIAAGALGGFVSALRRLYLFQRVFPVNFFKTQHKLHSYVIIYSMIPPLIGGIAAVVLYLIFASELINSVAFPKFHLSDSNKQSGSFFNFVENWEPDGPTNYAKALVWGFLAGFFERFVPSLLERLGSTQQEHSRPNVQEQH